MAVSAIVSAIAFGESVGCLVSSVPVMTFHLLKSVASAAWWSVDGLGLGASIMYLNWIPLQVIHSA